MTWKFQCLLCEVSNSNLVRIQAHGTQAHEITQDEHQRVIKQETDTGWIYRKPDGTPWMEAIMAGGNGVGFGAI